MATCAEIQRCNLSNVVLQMMSIGIKDVSRFHFLESPPADAVEGALRQLRLLGAVSEGNTLTDLGKKMAAFPLDPKFTKALLAAEELNCTEDVLTIVSMLSGDSILVTPTGLVNDSILSASFSLSRIFEVVLFNKHTLKVSYGVLVSSPAYLTLSLYHCS